MEAHTVAYDDACVYIHCPQVDALPALASDRKHPRRIVLAVASRATGLLQHLELADESVVKALQDKVKAMMNTPSLHAFNDSSARMHAREAPACTASTPSSSAEPPDESDNHDASLDVSYGASKWRSLLDQLQLHDAKSSESSKDEPLSSAGSHSQGEEKHQSVTAVPLPPSNTTLHRLPTQRKRLQPFTSHFQPDSSAARRISTSPATLASSAASTSTSTSTLSAAVELESFPTMTTNASSSVDAQKSAHVYSLLLHGPVVIELFNAIYRRVSRAKTRLPSRCKAQAQQQQQQQLQQQQEHLQQQQQQRLEQQSQQQASSSSASSSLSVSQPLTDPLETLLEDASLHWKTLRKVPLLRRSASSHRPFGTVGTDDVANFTNNNNNNMNVASVICSCDISGCIVESSTARDAVSTTKPTSHTHASRPASATSATTTSTSTSSSSPPPATLSNPLSLHSPSSRSVAMPRSKTAAASAAAAAAAVGSAGGSVGSGAGTLKTASILRASSPAVAPTNLLAHRAVIGYDASLSSALSPLPSSTSTFSSPSLAVYGDSQRRYSLPSRHEATTTPSTSTQESSSFSSASVSSILAKLEQGLAVSTKQHITRLDLLSDSEAMALLSPLTQEFLGIHLPLPPHVGTWAGRTSFPAVPRRRCPRGPGSLLGEAGQVDSGDSGGQKKGQNTDARDEEQARKDGPSNDENVNFHNDDDIKSDGADGGKEIDIASPDTSSSSLSITPGGGASGTNWWIHKPLKQLKPLPLTYERYFKMRSQVGMATVAEGAKAGEKGEAASRGVGVGKSGVVGKVREARHAKSGIASSSTSTSTSSSSESSLTSTSPIASSASSFSSSLSSSSHTTPSVEADLVTTEAFRDLLAARKSRRWSTYVKVGADSSQRMRRAMLVLASLHEDLHETGSLEDNPSGLGPFWKYSGKLK